MFGILAAYHFEVGGCLAVGCDSGVGVHGVEQCFEIGSGEAARHVPGHSVSKFVPGDCSSAWVWSVYVGCHHLGGVDCDVVGPHVTYEGGLAGCLGQLVT